jgi:predicted Zn-dependent peptidase
VVEIKPAALPAKPRVFLVNQPGAQQATILVGQVARSSIGLDVWNFLLANDVIGGEFSSRLNMNLREAKHWAYGAYSFAQGAVGQQPWIAFAPVQIDKTAESIVEMRREITDFASGKAPVTEDELAKVKANETRSLPGGYETGGSVLGQISGMITYQRPDDYVQNKQKIINAVSLEAARAAAADIHPDSLTWVVVGDLSKIEAPVRALNLGELQVIDSDGKPVK